MREYIVTLHEEPGDKFIIVFPCMADDEDHAEEQAVNAYPQCRIVNIRKVIFRLGQFALHEF